MKKAHNPRKAILIISDGGDNSSRYTESEVKNAVREADVQIYAIGIFEPIGLTRPNTREMFGPGLLGDDGTDRRRAISQWTISRRCRMSRLRSELSCGTIRGRIQPEECRP